MRKIYLLVFALVATLTVQAQVVMTLQLPPMGLTIKPQLWSLSLINTTNEALTIRMEMEMSDLSTGLRVLKGTSRLISLPRGIKQVQPGDVMPITYEAGNPGYAIDLDPGGFLPIGIFNICYSVIKFDTDAPELLTEECITLEVEPLSPPLLVVPLDSEYVELSRPFFAWMPPAPVNSYSTMLYDWILVEVLPTQSAADAIQQNIPVLTQQSLLQTTLQFPLAMPELDSSKLYAWRVTARSSNQPIANSDIWTFRVRKYEIGDVPIVPANYFAKLSNEESSAYTICTGILRFEFRQEQNSPSATVRIFDITSKERKRVELDSTAWSVQYGNNFIQIDLRDTKGMVKNHMYLVEVVDARKQKLYLKFQFRENPNIL